MQEKRFVLIRASGYDICMSDVFDTYEDVHAEMKREYEIWSRDCCGELNDDNAWCMDDNRHITNWRIFDMSDKLTF